jgi:hypothetical protein
MASNSIKPGSGAFSTPVANGPWWRRSELGSRLARRDCEDGEWTASASGRERSLEDWIGTLAAWLSALSTLCYLCTSQGLKNHVRFLAESGIKILEKAHKVL